MMNNTLQLALRSGALWVALLFALAGSQAQQALLKPLEGSMSAEQQAIFSNMLAQETTLRVAAVSLNFEALKGDFLRVNLFEDYSVTVPRIDIDYIGTDARSWIGLFNDEMGSAAFIWYDESRVQGHISSPEGNFSLCGIGDGVYMVAEHDMSRYGACGSDGQQPPRTEREAPAPEQHYTNDMGLSQADAPSNQRSVVNDECFIRLVMGYTPLAKTRTASVYGRTMNEHMALAMANYNTSCQLSNAEMRVELAHLYAATQNNTTSSTNDVDDLQATTDGLWDEIHDKRNFYDGDMCAMITDGSYPGLCGRAFDFDYTDPTNMFNVSEYNCAVENFTLHHEYGHTKGLRHDTDGTTTPFSYAHGFSSSTCNYRTIMAVSSSIPRINRWSNPLQSISGCTAGTTTFADNVRALNVGDFTIARHRTTPATFSTGLVLGSDESLNMLTTGTLTSTNTAPAGSSLILKSRTQVRLAPGFRATAGSAGDPGPVSRTARVFIEANCPGTSYSRGTEEVLAELEETATQDPFRVQLLPNPASEFAAVQFYMPEAGRLSVVLYDLQGRAVATAADGSRFDAGQHTLSFDVSKLASGNYLCRVMGEDQQSTHPLVVTH